jgi:TRAP-type C4-dicarboxylate transport system substrate-binding protein
MTRHMWDRFPMLGNSKNWRGLPRDVRAVISKNLNASAEDQREDYSESDNTLRSVLEKQGVVFNDPDPEAFRQVLIEAGFCNE